MEFASSLKTLEKIVEEIFSKKEEQRRSQELLRKQKFGQAKLVPTCPHGQAVKTQPSHG